MAQFQRKTHRAKRILDAVADRSCRAMTDEQFDALAKLLRLRAGPASAAARLVLVDGLRPAHAAARTGCSPQSLSNTLARCRRGIELARRAAGIQTDAEEGERK